MKNGVLRTRWVCVAALPDGGSTCAERGARRGAPVRIETEGLITEGSSQGQDREAHAYE